MNQITIRKATLEDMETLLRFEQGVIEAERPFNPTLKGEHTVYYDMKALITAPHVELLVAETAQQIVACGYARIEQAAAYLKHEQYAYLGFMYVLPAFRGQEINKMIMERLKAWTRTQQVTEMRLKVYIENQGAIKAYEKVGFSNHIIEMRMNLEED